MAFTKHRAASISWSALVFMLSANVCGSPMDRNNIVREGVSRDPTRQMPMGSGNIATEAHAMENDAREPSGEYLRSWLVCGPFSAEPNSEPVSNSDHLLGFESHFADAFE